MKNWAGPIERAVTLHRLMAQSSVTTNSARDGIVLWELQEQKCQQHVYQHLNVEQPILAGWMVLILDWKMVKFPGGSALVTKKQTTLVAKTPQEFM